MEAHGVSHGLLFFTRIPLKKNQVKRLCFDQFKIQILIIVKMRWSTYVFASK